MGQLYGGGLGGQLFALRVILDFLANRDLKSQDGRGVGVGIGCLAT